MLSEAVSILLPTLWPFYQGLYLMFAPEDAFRKPMKLQEYTFEWYHISFSAFSVYVAQTQRSPKFLITFNLGVFVYALVSWLSYQFTFPDLSQDIDWAFWIPLIIFRDLFITFIIYEPWHYLTYGSATYAQKISAKKFKQEMPDQAQWNHDRFWSCSGTVIAALHELVMIYLWQQGYAEYYTDFWAYPLYSLFWSLFCVWWRHFHFWFAHRMIHPWFDRKSKFKAVDVGQLLYDHAHSLHHKSYNPGLYICNCLCSICI